MIRSRKKQRTSCLLIASRRRNYFAHTPNAIKPIKISLSQPCSFILSSSLVETDRPKGGRWKAHTRTKNIIGICCSWAVIAAESVALPTQPQVSIFRILLPYREILSHFSSFLRRQKSPSFRS